MTDTKPPVDQVSETVVASTAPVTEAQPQPSTAPAMPSVAEGEPQKAKMRANKIVYDGTGGKLFGMMIVNFFLAVLTLGIYSFWGTTRVRRYLWNAMSINGKERLQYTGTAMELLSGYFKAMLVLVPLFIVLSWAGETGHFIIYGIFLIFFYLLFFCGIYLAMRYRLSRTKWRGIRFSLEGSALEYMKISTVRFFWNFFTLGYKIPESDLLKWQYMTKNMRFGKMPFSFSGSHKDLIFVNLVTLWAPLLPAIAVGMMFAGVAPEEGQVADPAGAAKAGFLGILLAVIALAGFMGRLWYRAALRVESMRGLKLGHVRFKSHATGGGYCKLKLVNALIIVFTLGMGKAWAINRNMRFECANLVIGGDLNQLLAVQSDHTKKSDVGDALAPDMDMGSALSIGI